MRLDQKITELRKRHGLSQEELAERLNVSRQAVSKWETGQSVPDLNKILLISELFDVSTDALLKEDQLLFNPEPKISPADLEEQPPFFKEDPHMTDKEIQEARPDPAQETDHPVLILKEEAVQLIDLSWKTALPHAFSIFLFIIAAIPLLLLCGFGIEGRFHLSETGAVGAGLILLLLFVALGVILCIRDNQKLKPFEWMSRIVLNLSPEAEKTVIRYEQDQRHSQMVLLSVAVFLYIFCVVPIFAMVMIKGEDPDPEAVMTAVSMTIFMAALGTFLILVRERRSWPVRILLQQGDFSIENKTHPNRQMAYSAWWLVWTAIYLIISFLGNCWQISWLCWPVAGILFPLYAWKIRTLPDSDSNSFFSR